MSAQPTQEQQQQAYQQYLQQIQQQQAYQQQLQQYSAAQQAASQQQYSAAQQAASQQQAPSAYPAQYPGYPPATQYPQYAQQQPPSYAPAPQYQQYQNRGYQQNNGQHSDRVLWVGNLHQEVGEDELRETFSQFGEILSIKLISTKACAFITYSQPQDATRAHAEMNHQQLHNQEIKVGWGKGESSQGFHQTQYGVGNNQGGRMPDLNKELPQMAPSRALWVGNVTNQVTEPVLREMFSKFGNVENIRLMIQKSCAFVTFSTVEEATNAKISMDKVRVADSILRVNFGKA